MLVLAPFFLCWGSFLNMLSYRLIHGTSLCGRSRCISCNSTIAWYDLFPILSWLMLRGSCRTCLAPISRLYPAIEMLTLCLFTCAYWYVLPAYWGGYSIFFSALLVTVRSDIETMLISRFATLFLIPVGIVLGTLNALPISALQSAIGAIAGYTFFWITGLLFTAATKKQGIGEGDLDLLAFIGSFTGIMGCWITVLIGSLTASLAGLIYIVATHKTRLYSLKTLKVPFGPFLVIGALVYVFFQPQIIHIFHSVMLVDTV